MLVHADAVADVERLSSEVVVTAYSLLFSAVMLTIPGAEPASVHGRPGVVEVVYKRPPDVAAKTRLPERAIATVPDGALPQKRTARVDTLIASSVPRAVSPIASAELKAAIALYGPNPP